MLPFSIKLFFWFYATPNLSSCVIPNTYYIIFQCIIFRVCLYNSTYIVTTAFCCILKSLIELHIKQPRYKKCRSNIQDEIYKTIYHAPCRDPKNERMIKRRTVTAFYKQICNCNNIRILNLSNFAGVCRKTANVKFH